MSIADDDAGVEGEPGRQTDLTRVRAVVVDANAMGKGGDLRLPTLRRISDVAARAGKLQLWVPEPILWEWCEHATREYNAAAGALAAAATRLSKAGVPIDPLALTLEQVRAHVEAAVRAVPLLCVLDLHPEDALMALRDQVLDLTPGERVSAAKGATVKTGGSDSAWIRAVHRAADGDSSAYLIVSADGDIPAAYAAWGITPPLMLQNVNEFTRVLEGAAFPSLTSGIVQEVVTRLLAEQWYEPAFDVVDEGGVGRYVVGDDDKYLQIDLALDHVVDVAAVAQLAVVDRVGSVQGSLFLRAVVSVVGWYRGQHHDRLESETVGHVECLLRTQVLLAPDPTAQDGLDLTFEGDGRSHAHPLTGDWAAAEDAFEELLEALRALPGCGEVTWPPPTGQSRLEYETPFGVQLDLDVYPDNLGDEWVAEIDCGGTRVTVSCNLLDSSYLGETWTMHITASIRGRQVGSDLKATPWACAAILLPNFGLPVSTAQP